MSRYLAQIYLHVHGTATCLATFVSLSLAVRVMTSSGLRCISCINCSMSSAGFSGAIIMTSPASYWIPVDQWKTIYDFDLILHWRHKKINNHQWFLPPETNTCLMSWDPGGSSEHLANGHPQWLWRYSTSLHRMGCLHHTQTIRMSYFRLMAQMHRFVL